MIAAPRGVGQVLALARDGQLEDRGRKRREDDHRERAEHPERPVVLVSAAEEHAELERVRDAGDHGAERGGDRRDEDVAVLDVGELVREHAAHLVDRACGCSSPTVTASAACFGLRPVAKAFGCSDGMM